MFDANNIDQNALHLTQAIGLQEGGGKFLYDNKTGDASTSKGAYQWQPGNFENAAKQYGLDPTDFSPKNQNKVAYMQVKSRLDAGLKPWEVASEWNSGSKDNWQNHSGDTVINGKTIHYDTPAYVQGVKNYYSTLAGGSTDTTNTDTGATLTDPLQAPEVKQHIQDMLDQGKSHTDVHDFIKSIKEGTEPPANTQTTPTPPGYWQEVGKQITEGINKIGSSISGGADTLTKGAPEDTPLAITATGVEGAAQSFLGTFGGALQTVLSPVTPIVSKMVSDVVKNFPEIGNMVGTIAKPLNDLAAQNPKEATVIGDGINALLAALGEKLGADKIGINKGTDEGATATVLPKESVGTSMSPEDMKGTFSRTVGGRNILSDNPEVVNVLQREGAFPDVVDGANGKKILNTENAYNHLGDKISEIEDNELQPLLQGANKVSDMQPLDTIRQEAIDKIKTEFKASGNVDSGIAKVNKYFDDYQKSYGDFVSLSDVNDMKRGIRKSVNFNSDVVDQSVAYQMGQVFMKNIENGAKTLGLNDVGEINSRMAELIKAQDALEKINGKPAPLNGWAKFKANNPIKASIIKHGAKAAIGGAAGAVLGGKAGAETGSIIGGAI